MWSKIMGWFSKDNAEPVLVGELTDIEIKILSRYIINLNTVNSELLNQVHQLTAEVQVLREVVDELESINSNNIEQKRKLNQAKRKTSPFRT